MGGAGNDKLNGKARQGRAHRQQPARTSSCSTPQPDKKKNLDKITDYTVADDTIWLDNKVFSKLGKKGSEAAPAALNKKFFKVANKAKDKDDYLVYDKTKGVAVLR